MESRTGKPPPQVDKWGSASSNELLKLEISWIQMEPDVSNARATVMDYGNSATKKAVDVGWFSLKVYDLWYFWRGG